MARVIDEKRTYQRILPNSREVGIMRRNGFTPLASSNVSAASERNGDLYVRFWNGSIYRYPKQGKNFERLVGAASHGKWVWRFLRRANAPYEKVGSLPLDQDIDVTDEELFNDVGRVKVEDITQPTTEELNIFNRNAVGLVNIFNETTGVSDIAVSSLASLIQTLV